MTYLIRSTCCRCHDVKEAYGLCSEGDVCYDCAPWVPCHDCGTMTRRSGLSDLGDGYLSCAGCQVEVGARQASAERDVHAR